VAIDRVRRFAEVLKQLPQIPFVTEHMLHAGMYTRTVRLPPETAIAAVLIKVPTVLITVGQGKIYTGEEVIYVQGYSVLPGSAGRKCACITDSEFAVSMIFPTTAKTVEEAEKQFTDEGDQLIPLSEIDKHTFLITGE
jgi:hypothetical protein